ncbi:reverse transcriptase, partial [Niallia circulans]
MNLGYTKAVSTILANICTLNDSLPQGASTSPALSNLIFIDIDKKISKYCMKNKIRYTRYADDLTFSGDFETGKLIKYIRNTLSANGFTINES